MSEIFLLDTSVLIASIIEDEPARPQALALLADVGELHGADVLGVELANGLMKAVRRKRISAGAASEALIWWGDAPWQFHSTQPHLDEALHLALKHDAHVYDLLHLLAAKACGGQLITLDERLVTKAASMRLGKYARLLKGAK